MKRTKGPRVPRGFLYEFFYRNWNCWTCHLLSWSVTVCLPVCLRNTCKTVYAPKSLSSTLCFVQKKKKAAFLPWLLFCTFIWFCNIFLSDLFCCLFGCVFMLFMNQRTHSIFDISDGFCLTIYEKRQRMVKYLAVPQCLQWHARHFLQSASLCPQSSCWIWQQSLSQPYEFLRVAHEPQSGISAPSVLSGFNLKRVRNEGPHEQLCAWLSFVLFPAIFFPFFLFFDVNGCVSLFLPSGCCCCCSMRCWSNTGPTVLKRN